MRSLSGTNHAACTNSPARCTVPLPTPTSAATLCMPCPASVRPDGVLHLGAAQSFGLCSDALQAGTTLLRVIDLPALQKQTPSGSWPVPWAAEVLRLIIGNVVWATIRCRSTPTRTR